MRNVETDGKRRAMVKIFVMLAILVGLSTALLKGGGMLRGVLGKNRMSSDIALLNNAVRTFKSRGGAFSPEDTIESVLTTLKSVGADRRLPGFSGALVDEGLTWKIQSEKEAASDQARVTWNRESERFEIRHQGEAGVASFSIAPSNVRRSLLETEDQPDGLAETENGLLYSENSGWIWEYSDEAEKKAPALEPTRVNLAGKGSEEPDRWIPVALDISDDETPGTVQELLAPTFSKAGGTYPFRDFDLKVSLLNPNPAGSSEIVFSIDYGPWKRFSGSPIVVRPGETIIARTQSSDILENGDSMIATATYNASEKEEIAPSSVVRSGIRPPREKMKSKGGPEAVTLSFGDAGVVFQGTGNHYYTNIGGTGAKMGLLVSDRSSLRDARKSDDVTGNGETCAFWLSNGLETGSTTITMDLSENPALDLEFKIYDINVAEGGDKLTLRALTDRGTALTDPEFVFAGNSPDGITYNPAYGEARVAVRFAPPAGEAISSLAMTWEGTSPAPGVSRSIGLGEVAFHFQPEE